MNNFYIILIFIIFVIITAFIYYKMIKKGRAIGSAEKKSKKEQKEDRSKLPYRPVAECYLVHDGKLIAQDHGHYIMLPGGGIDDGETPEEAGRREIEEEVGIKLDGDLIPITTVEWDWMPEWANNEKRKDRYNQFRGERVHFMVGKIKSIDKPISKEGDAWSGDISIDFDNLLNKHTEYSAVDHPNTKCYRSVQKALINVSKMFMV